MGIISLPHFIFCDFDLRSPFKEAISITQRNDNKQETFISIKALEKQIESVRQKMIECQNIKGFHDEETIKISQQLDDLIVQYQRKRKET